MPDQSSSSTEAVVRSYLASFATADPDAIAAHVSDDFANRHTSALGSRCDGRDAYRERLPDFLASMPGLEYGLDELVIDGDRAAAFYTLTGTWGGVPFSVQGAQRLVVRDGQITSRLDHWDSAVFLRQVDEAAATALRSVGLGLIRKPDRESHEIVDDGAFDIGEVATDGGLHRLRIPVHERIGDLTSAWPESRMIRCTESRLSPCLRRVWNLVGPKELIEDLPVQFDEQRVAARRSNRGVELTIEAAERFDVEIVGELIGDRADGSVIADIGTICRKDEDRTFEHRRVSKSCRTNALFKSSASSMISGRCSVT